jgi:superfamily II DNA/RNA helicase
MPKSKKPAGGRPAKNYDPSRAPKSAGVSAGSRSPKHRGYRPEETAEAPKRRWSADERAAKAGVRGEKPARAERGTRDERPARDDRPVRAERTDRPRFERSERPARRDDRDDRPARRDDRDERPARRTDRDDRPARAERGAREERRPLARGERPRFDHVDRPARRDDRDERPARRTERDDRPARAERSDRSRFDRNDRPARRDDRDDRPTRGARSDRPVRAGRDDRGDRPERRDSSFYPDKSNKPMFSPEDDVVLERLEAQSTLAIDVEGVSFGDLGLGGNICRALEELGASAPFPIQAATIPEVLAGRDVLGRGRTGSGKTIAFGAPLVERLMENNGGKDRKMGRSPRALIMAPTRELALQIDRTVQPIARSVGLFTTQIYGGVPQGRQVTALRRGVDIIIATPGRLEDLVEQRHIDLSKIQIVVLDEADHMCDLGFLEPVQRILRSVAPDAQHLLFSATLDRGVAAIIDEFLENPSVHEVAGEDQASSTIDHRVFVVDHKDKPDVIRELCERNGKTLVFTRTRAFAEMLADQLDDAGIPATSLHGDLNQNRRTRNLQMLTSGRVDVLVATDVAARGIHVDDVDLVIQADAPDEYKTYLHRAGRTGRAGRAGTVVTIVPKTRQRRMTELLDRADIEADLVFVRPGDDVIAEVADANVN